MSCVGYADFWVVLFAQDEVVFAGNSAQSRIFPSGNYIAVLCELNDVGGHRTGLTNLYASEVEFRHQIRFVTLFVALWHAHELLGREDFPTYDYNRLVAGISQEESNALTVRTIELSRLNRSQRRKVIRVFSQSEDYSCLWDNASREVKRILGGRFTRRDKARELLSSGVELASDGHLEEAHEAIRRALQMDTTLIGARLELGKVAIQRGDIQEAIEWFKRELGAKDPMSLSAHDYLAAIYRALGDWENAERHSGAAMRTPGFRRMPSALAPEVVSRIQSSVTAWVDRRHTVTQARPSSTAKVRCGKWWQLWK
jgi:tetratricopeptide (TPR) repeat protein